jgi:hypothetical protein
MSKFLFKKMSRLPKVIEKTFKINNYDQFINLKYSENFKILGISFPSSRMSFPSRIKENYKKPIQYTNIKKSSEVIDKKFTDIEKIIGLDFPSSRFK